MEGSTLSAQKAKKRKREALARRKKGVLAVLWATLAWWQMFVLAAAALVLEMDLGRTRHQERAHYISTLKRRRDQECISQLRLNTTSFDFLCTLLRNRGLLQDTQEMKVEEQVALFLHTFDQSVRNRTFGLRFSISGETVCHHFRGVLNAILSVSPNFIPPGLQDCVSAVLHADESQSQTNKQVSGDFENGLEDVMVEIRMGMTSDEGSRSKKRKRNRELVELTGVMKEASETICKAINGLAEKMVDPIERMSTAVYKELENIPKLSPSDAEIAHEGLAEKMVDPIERMSTAVYKELENIPKLSPSDAEIAHEWLIAHLDKARVFLHVHDKKTWVFKRLPRIRREVDQ